jgi:hypothetical protein
MGDVSVDGKDIWGVNNILPNYFSVLSQESEYHSVENEILELQELNGSESGDRGNEKVGCLFEITGQYAEDTFENLELVLFIPIGAVLDQLVAGLNIFLHGGNVFLFDRHQQDFEQNLHFS